MHYRFQYLLLFGVNVCTVSRSQYSSFINYRATTQPDKLLVIWNIEKEHLPWICTVLCDVAPYYWSHFGYSVGPFYWRYVINSSSLYYFLHRGVCLLYFGDLYQRFALDKGDSCKRKWRLHFSRFHPWYFGNFYLVRKEIRASYKL